MADPWLVIGLGNPGERYAATRHNAGAMVVERLCERFGVRLRTARGLPVRATDVNHADTPLLLAVPGTWMNVCGPPVASFARKRGVPVERIVACHDEIDLGFGGLKVKRGGSTAGHHGLDSMVESLHSADFFRVRIGIGRPVGRWENVDFLLEPFAKRERDDLAVLIEEAADAALVLVTDGLAEAQARYNRTAAPTA